MTLAVPRVSDAEVQAALDVLAQAFPVASKPFSVNGMAAGSFSAYRQAAYSVTTGQQIVFEAEENDVSGWYDTAAGRYTPKLPGRYRLSWLWGTAGTGMVADQYVQAYLRMNGAAWKAAAPMNFRSTAAGAFSGGTAQVKANGTTDYFDVRVDHNQGGTLAMLVGSVNNHFAGELIGTS